MAFTTKSCISYAASAFLPASMILSVALLSGCGGGEQGRMTTNSPNLSGLWRIKMDGDTDQIDSVLGFSFTLVDNGGTLTMVPCAGRTPEALTRNGNVLTPLFAGDVTVTNNDTLRGSNEYGNSTATKMALNTTFDMGSFGFQSALLGNANLTDVCTNTITAKYLGVSALDTVTVYTRHRNTTLAMELTKVGKFNQATYNVGTEITDVTVALESTLLRPTFGETRVTLSNGTITITKSTNVWLQGEVRAQLPNGQPFTSQFNLEKP